MSDQERQALIEETVYLVRQSAAVQEARIDAFLDAAELAAEQVQDVRIALLEKPQQATGWELWGPLALTFLLESNLAGAALKSVTRSVVGSLVKTNAMFLRIGGSRSGKELSKVVRQAAAGRLQVSGRSAGDILRGGFADLPGTRSKDALSLYHTTLQVLIRRGSDADIDLANAVVQVAGKALEPQFKPRVDPLPVTDSAGVAIVCAAQDYARTTRMGIRIRHDRIESFVRREASLADLAVVIDTIGWLPLENPDQQSDVAISLAELRNKYRHLLEALIWARLYGFSEAGEGSPRILVNQGFDGIRDELQTYWISRFQAAADVAAKDAKPRPKFGTPTGRLRWWFAQISTELTSDKIGLRAGELAALAAAKGSL